MKVFWSWQSDTPERTGKYLVRDALKDAVSALKRDVDVEPVERDLVGALHVDHDRMGVAGSTDLLPEILKKIAASGIFVADVTPVAVLNPQLKPAGEDRQPKRFINSNVAIELGYAYHKLTDNFVLLVMNSHYARIEDLPFDLRHKGGTLSYKLAPDADNADIGKIRKQLADAFEREIRLCLTLKGPEATASALIAIGPDIICEGELIGFDSAQWTLRLNQFVIGDENALIKFIQGFDKMPENDRYVALNALGDGRHLTAAPALLKDGKLYTARCPIGPSAERISAQEMPHEYAISPRTNDLYLSKGNIARVSGVLALPQRIKSALSFIRGEGPFDPTRGSRLQEFYWRFRNTPWLEQVFKLEIIRQASIPIQLPDGQERLPLLCVELVRSVAIKSEQPINGWLPIALELDVNGLGDWRLETDIVMPPADKVHELSKKGASLGLAWQNQSKLAPVTSTSNVAQERARKRLSVVTKRLEPAALSLEILYQPDSHHIGMSARVTLISPEDGLMRAAVPVLNPAPTAHGIIKYQMGGPFIGNVGTVRLEHNPLYTKTTLSGIMYIFPPETATEALRMAKVRIEIATDADEVLVDHELAVSPMR